MNTEDITKRLYHVRLLNSDIQKENEDVFAGRNIRVSPSGVLECERVFNDTEETIKVFYCGEFYVVEFTKEDIEAFENGNCPHHNS